MMTRRPLWALALSCALCLPAVAAAEGLLLQGDQDHLPRETLVETSILGQVATTQVTWTFDVPAEAHYKLLFPTPEAASVVGLAVDAGAGWRDAALSREDAPDNSGVGSPGGNDRPDLRDWLGANGLNVNVPAPNAGQPLGVRLTYIEILPYEFGEVTYGYPLAAPARGRVDRFTLDVTLATYRPLLSMRAVAFGATLESDRETGSGRRQVYRADDVPVDGDVRLRYAVEQQDLFTHVLTHHEDCAEDGYFLLIVEPRQDVGADDIVPKYFTFVIDTSGSMEGHKLDQAKQAAEFFVTHLNARDQFNIVTFSTDVSTFFRGPVPTGDENERNAVDSIRRLWSGGGTNLFGGLERALNERFDRDLARNVVLLTDGQPTEGLTSSPAILEGLKRANASESRIFTFGVGADVNAELLRAIAADHRGRSALLPDRGDFSGLLEEFFLRINRPVLTDVTLDFGTRAVDEVFPNDTTDLYAGAQLLVIGRYRNGVESRGELRGSFQGERQRHPFDFGLPACNPDENAFLPRLWAKGKIDALLDRIAREGWEDPVLVAEIEALALKYGIQTPYTSFAVPADVARPDPRGNPGSYPAADAGAAPPRSGGSSSPGSYDWGGPEDEGTSCAAGDGAPAGLALVGLLLLGLRRRR